MKRRKLECVSDSRPPSALDEPAMPAAASAPETSLGREQASAPTSVPVVLGKHGRPLSGGALAQALGQGHRGRKFPSPYTGTWGSVREKRSKLGVLTRRIKAELVDEYERPDGRPLSAFQLRLIEVAAETGALMRQAEVLWADPSEARGAERVTRRGVLVTMRTFMNCVRNLETLGGLQRRDACPVDVATSLRQASRPTETKGEPR